jgi:hypothetical protein
VYVTDNKIQYFSAISIPTPSSLRIKTTIFDRAFTMPEYANAVDDFILPTVRVLTSEPICGSPLVISG